MDDIESMIPVLQEIFGEDHVIIFTDEAEEGTEIKDEEDDDDEDYDEEDLEDDYDEDTVDDDDD